MILKQEEIVDRYPNGNIRYVETRAIISPLWRAEYPNHRVKDDGTLWIRVGVNRKFKPDGTLQWEIIYDNHGNVVRG